MAVATIDFFLHVFEIPQERSIIPLLSDRNPIIALPCPSRRALVGTWLIRPWRVKIHPTSPKVTQPLLALPAVVSLTAMWVILEQNKSHVVDAETKQEKCC